MAETVVLQPYWEIQGLLVREGDDEGIWHPLYQYREQYTARTIYNRIIDQDSLPKELQGYDDFRLVPPSEPVKRPKSRQERRSASAEGSEAEQPVRRRKKGKKKRKKTDA